MLNAVVGGWQTGGILTLQSRRSGNPFIGGVDNAATSDGGYDRPISTGISPYLSNPTAFPVVKSGGVYGSASGILW